MYWPSVRLTEVGAVAISEETSWIVTVRGYVAVPEAVEVVVTRVGEVAVTEDVLIGILVLMHEHALDTTDAAKLLTMGKSEARPWRSSIRTSRFVGAWATAPVTVVVLVVVARGVEIETVVVVVPPTTVVGTVIVAMVEVT